LTEQRLFPKILFRFVCKEVYEQNARMRSFTSD